MVWFGLYVGVCSSGWCWFCCLFGVLVVVGLVCLVCVCVLNYVGVSCVCVGVVVFCCSVLVFGL